MSQPTTPTGRLAIFQPLIIVTAKIIGKSKAHRSGSAFYALYPLCRLYRVKVRSRHDYFQSCLTPVQDYSKGIFIQISESAGALESTNTTRTNSPLVRAMTFKRYSLEKWIRNLTLSLIVSYRLSRRWWGRDPRMRSYIILDQN